MKKILLIAAIAFIIVSILAIMVTFQASSTFRNFTDGNGDNGDDHINPSNINQFLDNHIDKKEDSYMLIEDQYFIANCRNNVLDSSAFFSNIENIAIRNKILPIDIKFSK